MEAMEDDSLDVKDDHNHNYCASGSGGKVRSYLSSRLSHAASVPQPACPPVPAGEPATRRGKQCSGRTAGSKFADSDSGSESSEVSETDCTAPPAAAVEGKFTLDSTSKFLLNAMAVEDYRKNHWPNLEKAIDRLLIQNPTDHISVSYAQIYSYIYKCVCQQHSELLYNDLTSKITSHLQHVSTHLQASSPENFIENFNVALTQYIASLQCIVPVFMYLNKFYIESKLNRDLREDLMKLFAVQVAEKHLNTLMPLLIEAYSMPFKVQPSTMASVVKGLYSLRPEWAQSAPALFSGFIPQINPPTVESLLSDYAAHDQKLQMELSMNGYPRMQENNADQPPSLSQLLRESYLAEARAQQRHSEMSRSDASSTRLHIYGSLKGKAEDSGGNNDPQLPDLSAFLSQEELDKSVNLACQAIGHEPHEERAEPAPEFKELPATQTTFTSDRKMHKASVRQDNMIRNSRDSSEGIGDFNRSARNAPFGVETQSKKEFLNKAADFIEELSSLFKANSSKRVRPRACKTHRSRVQNKSPNDGTVYPLSSDDRERALMPVEVEEERPSAAVGHQPDVQPESGTGHVEHQDCRITEEQQYDCVSQEVQEEEEEEAESCALAEPPYPAEPVCEPPHFIQKLKSREVPEGSKVQLDCIVRGLPMPEVRWFCEGKELENSPDIQIITNGELHSLIIAEAFEEDTGRYSCFASNFYGTDSTSAEIYVEGASSSDSEGEQQFEHAFPALAQGDTELLEEQEASASVPVTSTTQQAATEIARSLPLTPVVPSVLPVQAATTQTQQPESHTSSHNYLQGLNGQTMMAAPVFTKSLQELLVSKGQLVVLECRVKGAPSPRVDWYREGKIIEDSPDFRILQKKPRSPAEPEEICTLVIAEVFPEDSGVFTCTASNKYGTVSSTAALREVSRPMLPSPDTSPKVKGSPNHQNGSLFVVPLPDPPPNSCLKTGTPTNHKDSRSSSRVGLRVHFRLPEDEEEEQSDTSTQCDEDSMQTSLNKEPPPVLAKPKLDSAQLQLLHNQVLMEQQQETEPPTQTHVPPPSHPPFSTPPPPKLSTVPTNSTLASEQILSPAPLLRSTHASLMNLSATSYTFNYTRPREFIAAQTFSPVRSPSPTESPVPLLHELAAELNSSAASSPTLPPFPPPHRILPTRVLKSPTSPPSLVSSPTPGSAQFPNSVFALRAQSPPQASSPTSSSSTPSPIQNPVAFLSSVLPSLSPCQPTNSMGLPKGAPLGLQKKVPRVRLPSAEDIRGSKEVLLHEIEKKLKFKDNAPHFAHQQEYKVSSFEQRLMSEIEFRLERTPVEESDDEVQHDDVPTGRCIAPIFEKKLKNFKAVEGVPVTFSCKVVGIPLPKVYWFKDGKQILRKNIHYKKIREGDGTCALHIESTTSDDDGNYTIMAANPQGRISCSGHLIVQTGPPRNRLPPIHSQRVRARIQQVEGEQTQERFFQPHFLQAPGDMLAHEGRLCRLDCKVSGLPIPELMWLVNGTPIYPDLYHKLLVRENGVHSLVIDPLTQNDGGTYTCIASNKAGQSSFSLELKVVEKETKHPPQFVEKLQNMGIPEGAPVRLECRVVGMPPPVIFWKKDNDSIPKNKDRISVTQDATGYVCLLIQPTTKDDAGWYTVSAKNEAGIVSCTCRLDIYAQWHQSVPAPMKKAPRTGSRYAALTGQGLDIRSSFPTLDTSPFLFSSSPPEVTLESEEL
ncbi:putative myopalladin [Scophthalmus maximus]|uniref:Myopalladin n=1 Tax=Scophthalmus maximus TaxID=52904 RepID=A0A2U9CE23_SCOMX|nr:putative myopalladin [Scophthalmus maximus]